MHTLLVTTVNASFLAFCSLSRAVSTPVVEIASPDPRKAPSLIPSAALEPIFRAAFDYGLVYPWRALAAFAPEKVFSDLIEAVLGAIYTETNGDLKAHITILRRFGVLEWVETALKNNVQIRHPKEEVGRLAGNKKVRYHVWIEDVDDHERGPMEELVDAGQENSRVCLVTGCVSRRRDGRYIACGAFRTVSSGVLQDEAGLDAVETRLAKKTAKHALDVRALPQQHPLWSIMNSMERRNDRRKSPLYEIWSTYYKAIQGKEGIGVTPRLPYTLPPWHDLHDLVHVHDEPEAGRIHLQLLSALARHQLYYTDASVGNGWAGISVVECHRLSGKPAYKVIHQETIGRETTCTAVSSEIYAIKTTLEYVRQSRGPSIAWIISDSQEALKRIGNEGQSKKSREFVAATLREIQLLREKDIHVKLFWIPGHTGILGNERAHRAARETTEAHRKPCMDPERRIREHSEALKLLRTAVDADVPKAQAEWGKYTYSIDSALPGKHTLQLYGALTQEDAGILAQARTGHTHLRDYVARTHRIDSADCECQSGIESVKHVILHCPLWASQRRRLQEAAGDRWGDVSYLLGGKSRKHDPTTGKPVDGEKWRPNMDVVQATVRFLKSTGRFTAQAQTPQHF